MTDDRFLRAFRELDAPVEPDAAFAHQLFEDLATDLGFRRGVRSGRQTGARVRRALGLERLPAGPQALRLAYLAAMLGLLLALLAGTLFVASQLRARPAPAELVRLSQAAYADAPPVRFTIRDSMGTSVVASDGNGTWRSETWDTAPGSYMLYDGERVGIYDSTLRTWGVGPVENGGPPFPFNHEFAWASVDFPGLKAQVTAVPCPDPIDLGEALVAGRPADRVGCPAIGMEYWLDGETHLVLRTMAEPTSPFWVGPEGQPSVIEAVAFEEITPDPAQFAWTGPAGALPQDSPLASTVLRIGERPPAWSGETIEGQPFSTGTLPTPAAVLFFEPTCSRCPATYDDFAAAAADNPGVTSVVVGNGELGTVAGFVGQHSIGLDVVADPDDALRQAWGITVVPALILLDGEGLVTGMAAQRLTPSDLDRMLAAAADGSPIPTIAPAPDPTATPSIGAGGATPGAATECGEAQVTCLPVGSKIASWSGPLLGGGTLDSADLEGKPAVIWFWSGARCEGPCPAWVTVELKEFQRLAEEYATRAAFVMVSSGETLPGDTEKLLADAGIGAPQVFDWEGAIGRAMDSNMGGVLVLDDQGRVTGQLPGEPSAAAAMVTRTLDRLLASSSPGPGITAP